VFLPDSFEQEREAGWGPGNSCIGREVVLTRGVARGRVVARPAVFRGGGGGPAKMKADRATTQ